MRNIVISPGEYYHIFNRGVNKLLIFSDDQDYRRFLFLILYFQSGVVFRNIGRLSYLLPDTVQHSVLHTEKVIEGRTVELVGFCLMPNHFHLIVKEGREGGIASYMQRVLNAYTKYINEKHKKSGHLFQGPYKAVHVGDNQQLLHLSAYIHRNPREMEKNKDFENYRWSSCQDYIGANRFEGLLVPEIVTGQFSLQSEYQEFVLTSPAKLLENEIE
ncbi:MAG: transposase [Patescibacteria group bacterium]